MSDVFTRDKRSAVMALIRGSGNKNTELRMITLFRTFGITGWRRNAKLFGKPDFTFPENRVAVFVDGCFWHRHFGCKFCYTPKSRANFWLPKFEKNVIRDRLVTRTLKKAGWGVIRVWQCELNPKKTPGTIRRIARALRVTLPSEPTTATDRTSGIKAESVVTPIDGRRQSSARLRRTSKSERCSLQTKAV